MPVLSQGFVPSLKTKKPIYLQRIEKNTIKDSIVKYVRHFFKLKKAIEIQNNQIY